MSLKRNLKIKYLKLLRKYNIGTTKSTNAQRYAAKIFKGILDSNDYEISIAPISGACYIKWKDVFFIFLGENVQIVNGKYFYDISISMEQSADILRICCEKIELKSKKIESEINNNVKRSLGTILNEINKN